MAARWLLILPAGQIGFVLFLDNGKSKCTAAVVALLDVGKVVLVMFRKVPGVEAAMFPHLL